MTLLRPPVVISYLQKFTNPYTNICRVRNVMFNSIDALSVGLSWHEKIKIPCVIIVIHSKSKANSFIFYAMFIASIISLKPPKISSTFTYINNAKKQSSKVFSVVSKMIRAVFLKHF